MPPSRAAGPRSFDEKQALENAIQVFWSKGYDGVTIDDLVAGMGVGRPSLYAVFGDKRTIFLRALRAYAEAKGALSPRRRFFRRAQLRDSLAAFLRHAVQTATEEGSAPGCLLICVAPARGRCRGKAVPEGCGRRGHCAFWNAVFAMG